MLFRSTKTIHVIVRLPLYLSLSCLFFSLILTPFKYGTVISTRYYKGFLDNLSVELVKGSKINITLIIEGKNYESVIDYPNLNRKNSVIRIMFSKKLKDYLSKELYISYNYIIDMKDKQNNNKLIKLPEELKEYMDFYKGPEKDTFIVKLIKQNQSNAEELESSEDDAIDIDEAEYEENNDDILKDFNVSSTVDYIYDFISSQGYNYDKSLIKNLYIIYC